MSWPAGWHTARLTEVCEPVEKLDPITTGRASIRYVDIGSVDGLRQVIEKVPEIPASAAPSRCRQVLREGDTVFSTVRPYLRKIGYIDRSLDGEFASTGFSVLRPGSRVDPRFLHYFLISELMMNQVIPFQKGVSYPAVLDREVRSCSIPIPPLGEQRRIVALLDDHLSRLDAAALLLDRTRRMALRLEVSWLQESLRPRRDEMSRVGDVLVHASGGWSRSQRHLVPPPQGIPYLKMNNIDRRGRLDIRDVVRVVATDTERSRYEVRPGDILFNSKNSAELVGKTAVADERVKGAVLNENIMRLRFAERLLPEFVRIWFLGPQMRQLLRGSTNATTGVAAVYRHQLVEMPIWVPDLSLQESIANDFSDLQAGTDRVLSSIEQMEAHARRLREAILRTAFSGQLTSRSQDESAEEVA